MRSPCSAKKHGTEPMRGPNSAVAGAGASQVALLTSHITSAHPVSMQGMLCVCTDESCPY